MGLQLRSDRFWQTQPCLVELVETVPARREFHRREKVFTDDTRSRFSVVLEGWACRSHTNADGRRQILGMLLPGDFFAQDIYSSPGVSTDITALTSITVEALPTANDGGRLLERVLTEAALSRRWIARLGKRSAAAKLIDLIDELVTRQHVTGADHVADVRLPLTQYDLADATGLTAIHVNRQLRALRTAHLIRLSRGTIEIPSLTKLREAAAALG